jgi:hypothetical protein
MARKKKIPSAPVVPQKTENQPTQAAPQPMQKDVPSGQSSTQTPPAPQKI